MLQHTGERMIQEHYQSNLEDHLIYLFHVATYRFAAQYTNGKKVLDFGCGSGYGTVIVSPNCLSIVGVDISTEAIYYAERNYTKPNLSFLQVEDVSKNLLPFASESFDVVLSFQVLEHIREASSFFSEIVRVLTPGGILILATPDRKYRLFPFQRPWNIWHVHEYSASQLKKILEQYFIEVEIQKMGGKEEFIRTELHRIKRNKWLTLPFTLPITPEPLRRMDYD